MTPEHQYNTGEYDNNFTQLITHHSAFTHSHKIKDTIPYLTLSKSLSVLIFHTTTPNNNNSIIPPLYSKRATINHGGSFYGCRNNR